MARRILNHHRSRDRFTIRKTKLMVSIALVLSLGAAGAVLARRGILRPVMLQPSAGKDNSQVVPASFDPGSPAKELIYAGSRLIATEEQPAPACSISISPSAKFFAWSGGSGSVSITAPSGCPWAATASAAWIILTSSGSGMGSGNVTYELRENFASTRTGTITIAERVFTIMQGGYGCTYSIVPTMQSFVKAGGDGVVNVTAASGCGWIAISNNSWITISSGASGTGNGTVLYSVQNNTTGAPRTGTISIANRTLTVDQKK